MFYIGIAKVDRDVAHVQWLYMYVSGVCSNCFICFRRMLQVFHLGVAKVDMNVAYTCMLKAYVLSVFSCFKHMFKVFHLDVAYILQWLHTCFSGVSDICC